jgi:hypothetical protein
MDPARLTPTGRRKSRPYVPEGTEARGRSGFAATGTGAGEGLGGRLAGPGRRRSLDRRSHRDRRLGGGGGLRLIDGARLALRDSEGIGRALGFWQRRVGRHLLRDRLRGSLIAGRSKRGGLGDGLVGDRIRLNETELGRQAGFVDLHRGRQDLHRPHVSHDLMKSIRQDPEKEQVQAERYRDRNSRRALVDGFFRPHAMKLGGPGPTSSVGEGDYRSANSRVRAAKVRRQSSRVPSTTKSW